MLSILISGDGGRPTQPNTNFKIIRKLDSENMAKIEMETTRDKEAWQEMAN